MWRQLFQSQLNSIFVENVFQSKIAQKVSEIVSDYYVGISKLNYFKKLSRHGGGTNNNFSTTKKFKWKVQFNFNTQRGRIGHYS